MTWSKEHKLKVHKKSKRKWKVKILKNGEGIYNIKEKGEWSYGKSYTTLALWRFFVAYLWVLEGENGGRDELKFLA